MWLSALLALTNAAFAAKPSPVDGFRVHSALGTSRTSLRAVYVPGPVHVFQQVPRTRYRWNRFSADLQMVFLESTSSYMDGMGFDFGQTLVGLRLHRLRKKPSTLVLELGATPGETGLMWGSHSVETAEGYKAMLGHERDWSLGPMACTTRVTAGIEEQVFTTYLTILELEAAYTVGVPIASNESVWLLHELDWQASDEVPLSARLLGRVRPGEQRWSIDLGAQYSVSSWNSDRHRLGALAQVGVRH